MNLKDQVCSLELAKKMNEGVGLEEAPAISSARHLFLQDFDLSSEQYRLHAEKIGAQEIDDVLIVHRGKKFKFTAQEFLTKLGIK